MEISSFAFQSRSNSRTIETCYFIQKRSGFFFYSLNETLIFKRAMSCSWSINFIGTINKEKKSRAQRTFSVIIIIAWAKQYINPPERSTGKFEAGCVSKNCSCLVTKISRNSRPQGVNTPVLERAKGRPQSFLELPHVCLSPSRYHFTCAPGVCVCLNNSRPSYSAGCVRLPFRSMYHP